MHIEEAGGNLEQNKKYCSKEGNFWEHGTPKNGGDIQRSIKEKIDEFKTMDRAKFIEENLEFYTKFGRSLREIQLLETSSGEKNIEVHWGVSGAGKTHGCYAKFQKIYKYIYSSSGSWFDGYDPTQHETLLIDEFKGQIQFTVLL